MSDQLSRNTVIESLGVYLPSEIASTRDVIAGCSKISRLQRSSATRIEKILGIKRRRLAADTEPASEMAMKAIQNCIEASRCQPSEIDLLLYCSISRYSAPKIYVSEPAISLALTAQFPFRNALAMDISNGCAGMFTAINIADSLIKSGLIRTALIVSGEHITDLMKTAQKETSGYGDPRFACLTLGDAAAALILKEGSSNVGFHSIELYTVAQFSECCIGKPTSATHGGVIMYTESAKLFSVAENYVIPDVVRALQALDWGKEELDHIISHQTAQGAIDTLYEVNRLSGKEVLHNGNVINNLSERGNTASTSHFVALWDNIQSGRINSGDRMLFAVQGSGMTIGTASYTLDNLPDRVRHPAQNGNGSHAEASHEAARTIFRCSAPRVRIESIGTASVDGPTSGMELAARAMEDCLTKSSYTKEDIGLLIFAGVHRDEFIGEPAIAALLAGRSNINDTAGFPEPGNKTFAFDVYNGSIGFLNACYIVVGMIRARPGKCAMIVASEMEPNAANPEWDQLGIAASGSAVILDSSSDGITGFGHCVFESFPHHIQAFASWLVTNEGIPRMHVKKHESLEAIYLQCIPQTVKELLKAERLRMEDIKVILPPQISTSFVPALAQALVVETSRFVNLAVDDGGLSSSSLAHSFVELGRTGHVAPGDVGLVISVGSGLQVGAATYYF